jgi:hypothetical protein
MGFRVGRVAVRGGRGVWAGGNAGPFLAALATSQAAPRPTLQPKSLEGLRAPVPHAGQPADAAAQHLVPSGMQLYPGPLERLGTSGGSGRLRALRRRVKEIRGRVWEGRGILQVAGSELD